MTSDLLAFYWAAREGKAQSRNEKHVLSMSKKDKVTDGNPGEFYVFHSPFNEADFWAEGTGHFMWSGKQLWKSIWIEHKIIACSYWPHIYAQLLSKYSLRMK